MTGSEGQVPDQLERVTAALADQYAIERELGSGGMATVYLARDLKHERQVAVKVLHPDLAASLGAERFLREIRITAKLSHPHILPLYDSGSAGGFLYYVMPFVQGESLADLLAREKQLSIRDTVQIVRDVAEALGHAHSHGLVHRDIKPQNVMMSGGHAIVADFGIARAVSEAGGDKLTQTGMAVGTPSYMSPEQIGGAEVDGRSDIYSLGCVLYELLVGQVPFTGPTPMAVMARHSMDTIPPPNIMRPGIPEELEDIIFQAMAKVPADRYRTMYQMAEALAAVDTSTAVHRRPSTASLRRPARWARRRWVFAAMGTLVVALGGWGTWRLVAPRHSLATAEGGLDPRHLAVLYFEDDSPAKDLEYVADGLTEGLIEELTQVPGLSIISRNGVAPYRNTALSRDSVARALGVGSLIVGSVEPEAKDRLRVTARLVEGSSGADLQRTSFVLPRADLLAIRDSALDQVASILREALGEEVRLRERKAGTSSVAAWALLQRAERVRKDGTALLRDSAAAAFARLGRADSLLAVAEGADPSWPEPIILRGQIAYQRARAAETLPDLNRAVQQAVAHAEGALALTPDNPKALELRGTTHYFHWILHVTPDQKAAAAELAGAKQDLEKAVQIEPTLASAYSTLSHLYYQTDDVPSALLAAQKAYEQDAYLSAANDVLWRLFLGSYDLEQFTQAQHWCLEGNRRFPGYYRFVECQLWLMTTPAVEPDPKQAWRLLTQVDSLTPEAERGAIHHRAMMVVGAALARAGLKDSARHVLVAARGGHEVDPNQELLSFEAFARTLLGDDDEAINLLKRYVAANHPFKAGGDVHWWWRRLQTNPHFRELEVRTR